MGTALQESSTGMQIWLPGWWSSSINNWQKYPNDPPDPDAAYHGQDHEDLYAHETFFWNRMHGTYLEMGALNGIHLSNTLYFSEAMGWRGMLIEPSPENVRLFLSIDLTFQSDL